MFLKVLKYMQYKEFGQLFWHKTGHGSQTTVAMHTSSVKMGIIGYLSARAKNLVNLSEDPLYHHNFIEHAHVTRKFKAANGIGANPYQMPERVAQWISGAVCIQVVLYWLSALVLVEGRLL
jgi:hypothetical protein